MIWNYIRQLVGNGKAATIGIFAFLLILFFLFYHKAHAAEVDVLAGTSFGTQGYGPVIGLNVTQPLASNPGLSVYAGTSLWGSVRYEGQTVPNNWDWHTGIQACKWKFCAHIGPDYIQRVDAINGAHTNFNLGFSYKINDRFGIYLGHISDAGTTQVNVGRQALSVVYRLQ